MTNELQAMQTPVLQEDVRHTTPAEYVAFSHEVHIPAVIMVYVTLEAFSLL